VHVPGLENSVADALSRPSPTPIISPRVFPHPNLAPTPFSPVSPPLLQTSTSSHTAPNPTPARDPAPEVSAVSAV